MPKPAVVTLKPSASIMLAFCISSIMLSSSSSPDNLACAEAIRGELEAQPSLSFIKSMLRFRTFCRLWMLSPDWWAKENEWSDSDGKRLRSSPKGIVGDVGVGPEM